MSSSEPGRGDLFIISSPSGGGKTSLVKGLLDLDPRLTLSISHTTRPPRPGEINGEHYHFVSETKFRRLIKAGDFVEFARVFDHLYGTSRHTVSQQLERNLDVLLDIDWQGARQVREVFPDCCSIFVLPPSLDILRGRLVDRNQDSAAVIVRRMRDATAEISHWDEFDQLIVNNKFDTALSELVTIINDHRKLKPQIPNKVHQRLAQRLGKS